MSRSAYQPDILHSNMSESVLKSSNFGHFLLGLISNSGAKAVDFKSDISVFHAASLFTLSNEVFRRIIQKSESFDSSIRFAPN
ncbi:hypothetical protein CEXT_94761 [Caerostris extrusa]|uniref:Uncharacterized protein n=1 Tax=Caerostris extrusa TaxID=172846 RepID=A0AAV4SF80_CAEEX|nr:hypothetical protein CEXT_94761 [Caerostris extrusa]